MRRIFTWLFRIVGVAGVVTSIALLVYVFAANATARKRVLDALSDMGIDDATVQVRSIGASHLQLTNLNIGQEAGLRIGAIGVEYDITSPSAVRVRIIEIVGAMLDLRMRNGRIDMGPLADLEFGDEPSLADDDLPFDELRIKSSMVLLQFSGRQFAVPFEATLTHQGQGVCDVAARITILGMQWPLTGSIDFTAPPAGPPVAVAPGASPAQATVSTSVQTSPQAAADGISFKLTSAGDRQLVIQGQVGGPRQLMSLAVFFPSPDAAAAPFNLVVHHDRDGAGSKLKVHATGSSPNLDYVLAGQGIQSTDLQFEFDAAIDLAAAKATANLSLGAKSLVIQTGGNATKAHRPAFITQLAADWSGDLTIKTLDDARLSIESLETPIADGTATLAQTALLAKAELFIPADSAGPRPARLNFDTHVKSLAGRSGANEVTADELGLSMRLTWDRAGDLVADGFASIRNGQIKAGDAQVALVGINVNMPIRTNAGGEPATPPAPAPASDIDFPAPRFEIAALRYKEDIYAPLTGGIGFEDGVLTADLAWPLFDESTAIVTPAPATFTAHVDFRQGLTARITAKVQDLHLTDETLLARTVEAAKAFRVTGHFGLDARLDLANGTLTPHIAFTTRDASFVSGELDFAAQGITTTITINSFSPLTTLPNQRLSAESGNLGKLNFKNAILNFRLDDIDAMVLELAGWSVGEKGRFWVHAARFDPLKPVLETQVFIEDMSVAEWLSILQDGEITGEGYMYGRLPIRIDQTSDLILSFGEGFLYAKPGKGWVKLSDRPQARREVYTVIEEAIANVARDAKLMLLEAVNDYEFDTLTFDFIRQNNGIRCVVFTSGRGRTGAKQPIGGFTVNINNFGALLSKQFLRSADSVGAVDDLLKRLFEGE